MQEHRFCGDAVVALSRKAWRGTDGCYLEAATGYNHLPGEPGTSKGGVAILLVPQWTTAIHSYGILYQNRVQWIILKGLQGGDLGIVNIYASNSSTERCEMWETIEQELPCGCC